MASTAGRGKLHVLVERARELRNVEMIMKKMDVFVRVKFANADAVTPVAKGMHKTPTWANPTPFEFAVRGQAGGGSAAAVLWVEALDKNYHNDALIGAGTLNVAAMLEKTSTKETPAFYEWVQLASAQGTSAGEVLLKVWFVPDAAPVAQQHVGVPTYQPGGVLPSRPPMHQGRPPLQQQQQQQQQQFPGVPNPAQPILAPHPPLANVSSIRPTPMPVQHPPALFPPPVIAPNLSPVVPAAAHAVPAEAPAAAPKPVALAPVHMTNPIPAVRPMAPAAPAAAPFAQGLAHVGPAPPAPMAVPVVPPRNASKVPAVAAPAPPMVFPVPQAPQVPPPLPARVPVTTTGPQLFSAFPNMPAPPTVPAKTPSPNLPPVGPVMIPGAFPGAGPVSPNAPVGAYPPPNVYPPPQSVGYQPIGFGGVFQPPRPAGAPRPPYH
ncbi:hypothetical protein GGF32_009871 [Allomyces javanicus]|nr:hypothetical protein GGF32_009871 [Allomyces javanicus]